ncbi:MAG TPA: hypothetical protein VMI94_02935 [Bryobacteraceae bacterium]|nr:hypothetical protein [Bryobacteraceae bacterium]
MFETALILAFSGGLFAYWFRYTVLLLLAQEQNGKAGPILQQLSLAGTREALRESPDLGPLQLALDKDYRLLLYLLDHAAGLGLDPLEQYLLILDYKMMAVWSRLTRRASASQSRRALQEMARVLSCIAAKMGERSTFPSHA